VRPPDRPADVEQRQPGVQPRDVDLLTGPDEVLSGSHPSPIQHPLATRHPETMADGPCLRLTGVFAQDPLATTDGCRERPAFVPDMRDAASARSERARFSAATFVLATAIFD